MSAKIRNLTARKAELISASRAVLDVAEAEGRDLTAEEQSAFESHSAKIKSISAAIDREQALAMEEANAVVIPTAAAISVTENIEADPKHGFKTFGEFAQSVRNAALDGGRPDSRLMIGAAAPSTTGAEGVGADGGFAVPPQYSTDIFKYSLGEDSLLPLTENTNIQSNSMVFPKTEQTPWGTNGVRAYWQAEATAATATKPVLGTQILRLHKLMALVPLTDELIADTNALTSLLPTLIGDSIRWKTNEAILFGTGSGQPLGALNSGAVITVAKDSGQSTNTLSALNIANMISRLPSGSFTNAVWLINPSVLPALFTLTLGNYPIYVPGGGTAVGGFQPSPYGMLLGRPIMINQHSASFSSQGDVQLHDLSYYRTITKTTGVQTDTSVHLYFDADATAFRTLFRVDGSPKIAAAISPAKGSVTLSPFIQLAAR
jgi:HK97 family phage major capsid protein